jgi:hypothetical protein
MPAWIIAGAPTKAAVIAAASNPAQIIRARVNILGASSVDEVEGDAGLDHGRSPDQRGADGGGQQPGPEQSYSRQHLGSSSVDRVEGDAGVDDGRSAHVDGGGSGGQQASADQTCACEHFGSFRVVICCCRYFGATTGRGWIDALL